MIEVNNLTKKYGSTVAVDNISFSVSKGEVLGFLGPNGAGKSTTMKVLSCFIPPTSGRVSVCGLDTATDSLEIRKNIGYLPENNPLYNDINVLESIEFISGVRGIRGYKRKSRIDAVVEICGLKTVLKKDIGELSKGFRQRVGLAQALVHDPEVLILDEPTSGLDPNQVMEIRALIKKLGEEKTIMISTHILPEVSATCGRIIIISNGKIVACEQAEDLRKKVQKQSMLVAHIRGPRKKVRENLLSIDFVSKVEDRAEEAKKIGVFYISVHEQKGVSEGKMSELIFQTVAKNAWNLRELRWEEISLENIFHELTMEEKQ